MKIITIWNLKGGTGKTTTTFNLAANLAKDNNRILLLDIDMQANLTSFFDVDTKKYRINKPDIAQLMADNTLDINKSIYHSRFNNIDYVRGSNDVMKIQLSGLDILGKHLAKISSWYDLCLIDCHPDASLLSENALAIADLVLIPINFDGFSRDNLNLVIKEIIDLESKCGEINYKIFVNKLKRLRSQRMVYKDLIENHDYPILASSISEYSDVQSAVLQHKPLYMHRSKSPVNDDYTELTNNVIDILEMGEK
jgi:chromosome partitioning protein